MAKLTLQEAEQIAGRGRPWTIRLEFVGANLANASGVSSKYWFATGRGINEAVEIGYGAIGSSPQYRLIDWDKLRQRVADKTSEGYVYAHTPYVRMSAVNFAKVTGNPVATFPTAKAVSSAPTSVLTQPPVAPAPVTPPPAPVVAPRVFSTAQQALGAPYSLIATMKILRQGLTITGYSARDASDDELMVLDPTDAVDFARDYDIDIVF